MRGGKLTKLLITGLCFAVLSACVGGGIPAASPGQSPVPGGAVEKSSVNAEPVHGDEFYVLAESDGAIEVLEQEAEEAPHSTASAMYLLFAIDAAAPIPQSFRLELDGEDYLKVPVDEADEIVIDDAAPGSD